MSKHASASTSPAELHWFKSSHSGGEGGECVEVAATARAVLVRDSKDVSRPRLAVGFSGWADFVQYVAGN